MNKLKTIGLSALAGSLAVATAANAVEYSVSGDAYVSYSTEDSTTTDTASGKIFAADTDLYFNASGELDNGFTVSFFQAANTNTAMSITSSQITLGMGSLGTLQLNEDSGSKANAIDDVMPNAMQETWDRVADINITNPSFFGAATAQGSVDYRIPTQELAGVTINASYTYDPNTSEEAANASSGNIQTNVSGSAIVLQVSAMGLEIGLGNEEIDNDQGVVAGSAQTQTTGYAKYAMGPLSIGYQEFYYNAPSNAADSDGSGYAVAYSAGDMTVSYSVQTEQTNAISDTAALEEEEMSAIQAAYTMGGMTIAASLYESDNVEGVAAVKYEETELSVSFAF